MCLQGYKKQQDIKRHLGFNLCRNQLRTEFNETALTFAVKYNPYGPDIDMLKLLIENGADINAKSNVNGETALIIASYRR